MSNSNPAFSRSLVFADSSRNSQSFDQLEELYTRPAASKSETDRMSYEDTVMKTLISFGLLVAAAILGWLIPFLAVPGFIVGFVLALVNILSYAAFQGLFVGGISAIFAQMWDGIVPQAVFGTLAVVGVTLFLFLNGKFRSSPRMTRIVFVAMIGYAVFSLVNLGLMVFGATDGMFGLRSVEIFGIPLGAILGVLVVFLAAYSLVMDFESIKSGVQGGAPRIFGWRAAFGILMTVVWLYIEILRLLAILRGD